MISVELSIVENYFWHLRSVDNKNEGPGAANKADWPFINLKKLAGNLCKVLFANLLVGSRVSAPDDQTLKPSFGKM